MNKKIIKNTFDKNINKDDIYNSVLNKVNNKKFNYLKLSIIPICVIVLVYCISLNYNKEELIKDNSDVIYINNIDNINDKIYDIDWNGISITKEELSLKFNWIDKLNNSNLDYSNYIEIKDDNGETYLMMLSYGNIYLEVFVSKIIEKKPRCVSFLDEKNIKKSTIDGVITKIYKSGDIYIVLFSSNEFNYDIEINNVTEEQFINLIKLILE